MPVQKKGPQAPSSVGGRISQITRETAETKITLALDLDSPAKPEISTTIAYFDHMLTLLGRHANIGLKVKATGDLIHHLVEDVGICLGQALNEALGDKKGIERYGSAEIPMDETLGTCAVDLSGRPYFVINLQLMGERIEDMAGEDIIHFFESFALNAKINLHVRVLYGENDHHKAESAFKALAHALKKAIRIQGTDVPSTKGVL
jgi:imidazoleglycerol-phosphate dehydratase